MSQKLQPWTPVPRETDPAKLRQALINVLWALKATVPRGTPYSKLIIDTEDMLWGFKAPGVR